MLRKLRFARIRKGTARRLGLAVKQTQSGYSYPEIPPQVENDIPNYYADSRKRRMAEELPADAGGFARSMGRYIFESLPQDPDRGATVEATIANVLDYAAHEATQAQDQTNATYLTKIASRWRTVIGKKEAAVDPDAPLNETAGFAGLPPAPTLLPQDPGEIKNVAVALAFISGVLYSMHRDGLKQKNDGSVVRPLGFGMAGAVAAAFVVSKLKSSDQNE